MASDVWIFCGTGGTLPSGVFADRDSAQVWIRTHSLSGMLTRFPVGEGLYEWAVRTAAFRQDAGAGRFVDVGSFTSALLEHHHYEDGICVDE
jgi:hypothetical protein